MHCILRILIGVDSRLNYLHAHSLCVFVCDLCENSEFAIEITLHFETYTIYIVIP